MRIKIESIEAGVVTAKFYGLTKAGKPSKAGKLMKVGIPAVVSPAGIRRRLRKAATAAGLAKPGTLVSVEVPS